MNQGIKKWVIDIVPPRKIDAQSYKGSLCKDTKTAFVADFISESLESVLNSSHDPVAELVKAGAIVKEFRITNLEFRKRFKTNYKSNNKKEIGQDFVKIINQIQTPITNRQDLFKQVLPVEVGYIKSEQIIFNPEVPVIMGTIADAAMVPMIKSLPKKSYWKISVIFLGILSFVIYGIELKNEVTNNSNLAFHNIKMAQANLKEFNFEEAVNNFNKSYVNFNQAGRNLSFIGAGVLGNIPGLSDLKSAKNLTEAGKLLTSSGQSLSEILSSFSRAGSVLNPNDENKIKPSQIVSQFKSILELSSGNLSKAKALLIDVDEDIIPQNKREDYLDFKEKLPIFEKMLIKASKYTVFLERVIGIDEHKKYLILFNNYSELRPTGGFPGIYGVVSFSNGGLENLFIDDVYNLDGQLKRKIIPPKQLQHITPTWGMRDAAWFADFPTSAKKVMSFFAEEAGYEVDGVIALNPDIISHILKVVGPIEMPEYNVTLTADNFLVNIQEEVEYGENRTQPKTIIKDLAPRLLERLYSASSEQWTDLFKELTGSLEEKDTIFYFEDHELENFAVDENFGGEIKNTDSNYLMVNFSNIKGSKTDIVTDSFINIDAKEEGDRLIHKVTIARKHKGGDHKHGFYNRQNPSYVRVLIPEDAELINVSGNDQPQYYPLVDYQDNSFEIDNDLVEFESGFYHDKNTSIDRFEESGLTGQVKKGVGLWMVTDPGDTKIVTIEYSVPKIYTENSFYFQKQPGLDWKNFKFKWNNTILVNKELKEDLDIQIGMR